MEPFTTGIGDHEKDKVDQLRTELLKQDENVSERVGKIMSIDRAFVYEQEGVFKYGLAKTSKHFTFHSMVMYAFPEVADFVKEKLKGKGIKLQKGCINFDALEKLPIPVFSKLMVLSARQDFTKVINHYKNK